MRLARINGKEKALQGFIQLGKTPDRVPGRSYLGRHPPRVFQELRIAPQSMHKLGVGNAERPLNDGAEFRAARRPPAVVNVAGSGQLVKGHRPELRPAIDNGPVRHPAVPVKNVSERGEEACRGGEGRRQVVPDDAARPRTDRQGEPQTLGDRIGLLTDPHQNIEFSVIEMNDV